MSSGSDGWADDDGRSAGAASSRPSAATGATHAGATDARAADAGAAAAVAAAAGAAAADAAVQAAEACARAGIRVVPVERPEQAYDLADLFSAIWGGDPTPLPGNALVALAHAGNYVVLVHDDLAGGTVVGGSVGWFCTPRRRALHSHITGLLPATRGRDLGTAVKLHQRAWALERGLTRIVWTYDPLIARNAHFNRNKLGARPVRYRVDCYGAMPDAVNAGDESDRFEVSWELAAPWPPAVDAGRPEDAPTPAVDIGSDHGADDDAQDGGVGTDIGAVRFVSIPDDIEALRGIDPAAALRWRHRLREELVGLLDDGWEVTGFVRGHGYVLRRAASRRLAPAGPPGRAAPDPPDAGSTVRTPSDRGLPDQGGRPDNEGER